LKEQGHLKDLKSLENWIVPPETNCGCDNVNETRTHKEEKAKRPKPTDFVQATILVNGVVQQVGFRKRASQLASGLGLKGFVENLENTEIKDPRRQPVKVLCQGNEERLKLFLETLRIQNGHIKVESVDVSYQKDFDSCFQSFYILRGDVLEDIGPRMDTAIEILKDMNQSIQEGTRELGGKIDSGFNQMDSNFKSLGGKIDSGFDKTDANFQKLDGKYHTVSEELQGVRKVLEKRLVIEEEKVGYSVKKKKN
jgi:acylphosphatase